MSINSLVIRENLELQLEINKALSEPIGHLVATIKSLKEIVVSVEERVAGLEIEVTTLQRRG